MTETQRAGVVAMTAERAAYFLRRFKHEEKMLGPNEQAALDFAIDRLSAASPAQALVLLPGEMSALADLEHLCRDQPENNPAKRVCAALRRISQPAPAVEAAAVGVEEDPDAEPAQQFRDGVKYGALLADLRAVVKEIEAPSIRLDMALDRMRWHHDQADRISALIAGLSLFTHPASPAQPAGGGAIPGVNCPPENYSWKCGECSHVGLAATFPVDKSYWSDDGDVRCPKCGSTNTDEAPADEWPAPGASGQSGEAADARVAAWFDPEVRDDDKGLSWTQGHFHTRPLYEHPSMRSEIDSALERAAAEAQFGGNRELALEIDKFRAALSERSKP